ncbi:MAG: Tfp pilus assembly protein PilF [Parcubacteria bacterium C7867-001]|nr:MAG: Tfp pilus assembly protein PilF [Parcubacteria bacterium C7867-001]
MTDSSAKTSAPKRFSFDTAASIALAITVGLAALLILPTSTVPAGYLKVGALAIGMLVSLVLFILARLTRGNVIVPPLTLLGAVWLLPIAYGLSTLFSGVNPAKAFFGNGFDTDTFGFMLLAALLATLAALAMRRPDQYRSFFLVSSVAAAVLLVSQLGIAFIGKVSPSFLSPITSLAASFVDLGMLAGLTTITILVALRFLSFAGRIRTALLVGLALALFALALTNTLIVWILVGLAALGLFIESVMRRKISSDEDDLEGVSVVSSEEGGSVHRGGNMLVIPLIVLVVSLFFVIGNSTIGNSFVNFFGTSIIDARPSWQSTFDVGSHTYASSPLFGSGPSTFGREWLKYRDRSVNDTVFWSVDFPAGIGYIPTSVVTTGAVGALAWLVFIGFFLYVGLRTLLLRASSDRFVRFVSISSFVGALYVLVLSLLMVPGPAVLAFGFVFLGIFISSLRYGANRTEWGVIFAKTPRVGFAIVFILTLFLLGSVLSAYVVTERYFALSSYGNAAAALGKGDLATADMLIGRSLLFAQTDRAYQLAASSGIAHMNKIANDTTLPVSSAQQQFQTALSNAIANANAATKIDPYNYQNWAVLGSVYQTVVPLKIDGAYDQAKTAYDKAMALNPTNPVLPFILAQLDIAAGNTKQAEESLVKSINLKHDYTQAIFLLSQLEVQQGKAKEALQAAEAAAYFAPNDPTVMFQVGILRSGNGDTNGAIQALTRAIELNPQYANARFFLGVMYALKGQNDKALAELRAVGSLSPDNAAAVASDIAALEAGKNPFPASRLGALGIPSSTVTEPSPATEPTKPAATPKTTETKKP